MGQQGLGSLVSILFIALLTLSFGAIYFYQNPHFQVIQSFRQDKALETSNKNTSLPHLDKSKLPEGSFDIIDLTQITNFDWSITQNDNLFYPCSTTQTLDCNLEVKGRSIKSSYSFDKKDLELIEKLRQEFEETVIKSLEKDDFQKDQVLFSKGDRGSQVGYKIQKENEQKIVVMNLDTNYKKGGNEISCPCTLDIKVFQSELF